MAGKSGERDKPVSVVAVRYKIERSADNPALYQVLAYCTVLGLPRGHLVYAKGETADRSRGQRTPNIEITQHALDLNLPPARLLGQISALAARLADQRISGSAVGVGEVPTT